MSPVSGGLSLGFSPVDEQVNRISIACQGLNRQEKDATIGLYRVLTEAVIYEAKKRTASCSALIPPLYLTPLTSR